MLQKGVNMKLGIASVDITPSEPMLLRGYAARNRLSNGVEDPIEAGCLLFDDGVSRVLLITIDNLGVERKDMAALETALRTVPGLESAEFFLGASHTHFAPGFSGCLIDETGGPLPLGPYPADTAYLEFVRRRLTDAARRALADLAPVRTERMSLAFPQVAFNRRMVRLADERIQTNYMWPKDPENYRLQPWNDRMTLWRFVAESGKPRAILANFGCHAVTGGANFYGISGDWPAAFRRAAGALLGTPLFFLQGTEGDVVPRRRNGSSRQDLAEIMARTIRLHESDFAPTAELPLEYRRIMIPVEVRDPERRASAPAEYEAAVAAADRNAPETLRRLHQAGELAKVYRIFPEDRFELPLTMMRLGGDLLVGLPFEVLSPFSLRMREEVPEAVVCALVNGSEGYLPPEESFGRGGYESGYQAMTAPGTFEKFYRAAVAAAAGYRKE